MRLVIRIICLASGGKTSMDNKYLKEYDPSRYGLSPDGQEMLAHIVVTDDIEEALHFNNLEEIHALWTMVDSRKPIRFDGCPNRPLTAFTIEILKHELS